LLANEREDKEVAMPIGQVKWFNDAKGYGFITASDVDGDVFVHFSSIEMTGFRTLEPDTKVEFDLARSDKGYIAQTVRVVGLSAVEPDNMAASA
jgi:CspA family cold shock protein